jgi:sortase A
MRVQRIKWRPRTERLFRFVGVALLGTYCCIQLHSLFFARVALWEFEVANFPKSSAGNSPARPQSNRIDPDFTLWSTAQIRAYRALLTLGVDPPIGTLSIPRLRLNAPVFEGTKPMALNRGLGRITGTDQLGGNGNIGIAGHRDSFFRVLKDIHLGDRVEVRTASEESSYTIESIEVVDPVTVSVLKSSFETLTLVTCYPFYFVGEAPRRFVVKARLKRRTFGPGSTPTAMPGVMQVSARQR